MPRHAKLGDEAVPRLVNSLLLDTDRPACSIAPCSSTASSDSLPVVPLCAQKMQLKIAEPSQASSSDRRGGRPWSLIRILVAGFSHPNCTISLPEFESCQQYINLNDPTAVVHSNRSIWIQPETPNSVRKRLSRSAPSTVAISLKFRRRQQIHN